MPVEETTEVRRSRRGKWLDAVGWTLFVVWIAAVFFVKEIPDGVGSLGLGILVSLRLRVPRPLGSGVEGAGDRPLRRRAFPQRPQN